MRMENFFGLPRTRIGWWGIGLALAFVALFWVMTTWPSHLGQLRSLWTYPPYGLVVLATGACGSTSGVLSGIGILFRRERSMLVWLTLLVGAFVLYFSVGEIWEGIQHH